MEVNPNFSDRAKEDFELVQRALGNDQLAFGLLMERYRDSIYFLIYKMIRNQDDSDDLDEQVVLYFRSYKNTLRWELRVSKIEFQKTAHPIDENWH